jgi:Phage capsid family
MTAQSPIPLRPDSQALNRAAVTSLSRACIATGMRTLDRNYGGHEKTWPHDRDVELVLRAPMSPTSTTNAAALAQIAYAFVAALVPVSAAAALVARSLQLSFDGAASISIPSLTLPQADFVGQGKPIPVAQGTSGAISLDPHKLATIVALSGEMMRNSNAEAIVRAVLLDNVGPSLDQAMFSNAAAVADVRPPGLLNSLPPLTPAAAGTTKADAMVDDIATLATAVAPVSGNGGVVLVAAPAQAVALTMRAPRDFYPVLMSAALPAKRVIAIAARALASAFGAPAIDASREAAVHMADPAAELIDIGGVMATPIKSMTQTDSVALRLRMPVAWALRSPVAIAWMDNVTW